ncbi:hypothetical protein [Spirosoma flavum]|uniref:Acyltransferase 3 domain-containing protein n=1 Tax=Spirosoma flavum TaxID=2048557 RepID=A0ABW6AQ99_9BACT
MWPVINKAIDYFDTVPPLLLLIMALATMRRPGRDYIVLYLSGQFLFNGYANLLNELVRDNLFAYSLNFSWAYFILSLYFAELYSSRLLKRIILSIVILYQINSVITLQLSNTVATFNSLSFGSISLLITIACLFYYTQQLSIQPKENILKVRDFWYVNGIFTYYTSNFFIFLTYNTLVSRNYANIGILWKIHNAVFLLMCIYFFIGMRCKILPTK